MDAEVVLIFIEVLKELETCHLKQGCPGFKMQESRKDQTTLLASNLRTHSVSSDKTHLLIQLD